MTASADRGNVVGNAYDKYGTGHPVERAIVGRFLRAITRLYERAAPETVLEVGCGEGHLAAHLLAHAPVPSRFVASDADLAALAPGLDPRIETRRASVYELPFADESFDLVLCCEVLEHLSEPRRGLAEVARVARCKVIVSTPREPLWRILNVARGRYLWAFGNTPGHVQHFSRRGLEELAASSLRVVESRAVLPWTILMGEPLRAAAVRHLADHHG